MDIIGHRRERYTMVKMGVKRSLSPTFLPVHYSILHQNQKDRRRACGYVGNAKRFPSSCGQRKALSKAPVDSLSVHQEPAGAAYPQASEVPQAARA
jgi:hypothetical protein